MVLDASVCVHTRLSTIIHKHQPAISPSINKKLQSQLQQLIGSSVENNMI